MNDPNICLSLLKIPPNRRLPSTAVHWLSRTCREEEIRRVVPDEALADGYLESRVLGYYCRPPIKYWWGNRDQQ